LPTPSELLALSTEVLRGTGLSGRKVSTLRALAAEFGEGGLNDEKLKELSDQEIQDLLTTIPGVGPWTVHGLLIIALDRDDVVLPGDLALRKAIQRCYGLDHLPSQAEVIQIAEAWRPHRSLATALLFEALEGSPETPSGDPVA
jgi:DNA-3-methyladenine glycosylase II